jgi:hypothetical protein
MKKPKAKSEIVGDFEPSEKWPCECGELHDFGAYVAAHWRDRLTHTCPQCGAEHEVHAGRVTLVRKAKATA